VARIEPMASFVSRSVTVSHAGSCLFLEVSARGEYHVSSPPFNHCTHAACGESGKGPANFNFKVGRFRVVACSGPPSEALPTDDKVWGRAEQPCSTSALLYPSAQPCKPVYLS
jgi:hypothetical protein